MQADQTVSLNATIRAELARRSKTQGALAEALGLSQPSVSARLNGSAEWRYSELQAVARFLDLRVETLVTEAATA